MYIFYHPSQLVFRPAYHQLAKHLILGTQLSREAMMVSLEVVI